MTKVWMRPVRLHVRPSTDRRCGSPRRVGDPYSAEQWTELAASCAVLKSINASVAARSWVYDLMCLGLNATYSCRVFREIATSTPK